jgi:hypothetical protein
MVWEMPLWVLDGASDVAVGSILELPDAVRAVPSRGPIEVHEIKKHRLLLDPLKLGNFVLLHHLSRDGLIRKQVASEAVVQQRRPRMGWRGVGERRGIGLGRDSSDVR